MKRHAIAAIALTPLLAASPLHRAAKMDVDDQDIIDALEGDCLDDPAVPGYELDVDCSAGIVTLTGTVDNLLARERAELLAEALKGVRAVINRIDVEPETTRTDPEIAADIEAAWLSDPATDSYEVRVEVADGHAHLSGEVDSWQERDLCTTVAKGVRGVREVTSDIEVAYAAERSDFEIEEEVAAAMRWNVLIDDGLVTVDVRGGQVYLTGTVGSAAEKRLSRRSAWVAGVKAVNTDDLHVARWARDPDLRGDKYGYEAPVEVEAALAAALWLDPRVDRTEVDLSYGAGIVTLRGVVGDLRAKRAAEHDARNTVGVLGVRNHLKVRPEEERADGLIEQDVRAALLRSPHVQRHEVDVDAVDGVVYLDGKVDSFFEKRQADDLAARVVGVTQVKNRIAVEDRIDSHDPHIDPWSVHDYSWYEVVPRHTFVDDWEIRRDIEQELFWSPFVDQGDVTVLVEDGVATLIGTVDSWSEKSSALENAYQGGATFVRNRLTVAGEEGDGGAAPERQQSDGSP